MEYRIISADDHIDLQWLPKDLWQKRVPASWRERAPKVVDTSDGPYWTCGNDRWDSWGGRKGAAGPPGGPRTPTRRRGVAGARRRDAAVGGRVASVLGSRRRDGTAHRLSSRRRAAHGGVQRAEGVERRQHGRARVLLDAADGRGAGRRRLLGCARAASDVEDRARRDRHRVAALHVRAHGRLVSKVPRRRRVLANARRPRAHDAADIILPAPGVVDLPDGSRRLAHARRAR